MFFYETDQFTSARYITEFAIQNCTISNMITMSTFGHIFRYINLAQTWKRHYFRSLCKQLKVTCIDQVYFHPSAEWQLQELCVDFDVELSQMSSLLLAHFIRCLCFHQTGNFIERDRCITNIIVENRKQNEEPYDDFANKLVTYAILRKIYRLINDNKAATYWTNHAQRYWEKHLMQFEYFS